jgi:hypothetical protein
MRRKTKPLKDDYPMPWEERPISVERWRRHRERIMEWEGREGHRPAEWWEYQHGLPQPCREKEADALYGMGELGEAELAGLIPRWREDFEKTLQPGFSYCIGSTGTSAIHIEGQAARRAYWRWAGIPRAFSKKWNAEYKRQARVVRSLGRVKAATA